MMADERNGSGTTPALILFVIITRTCGLDDTPGIVSASRNIMQNAVRTVRGARGRVNEWDHRKGERLVFRSMYWES